MIPRRLGGHDHGPPVLVGHAHDLRRRSLVLRQGKARVHHVGQLVDYHIPHVVHDIRPEFALLIRAFDVGQREPGWNENLQYVSPRLREVIMHGTFHSAHFSRKNYNKEP